MSDDRSRMLMAAGSPGVKKPSWRERRKLEKLGKVLERLSVDRREAESLTKQFDQATVVRLYYRFLTPSGYREHMERTNHSPTVRKILDRFKEHITGSLLDASVGDGAILAHLADYLNANGIDVTANDFTPEMLAEARRTLTDRINSLKLTDYDLRALPQDMRFRTILCAQSFHIIPPPKPDAAKSIVNALEKGGTLILVEEAPFRITRSAEMTPVADLLDLAATPVPKEFFSTAFVFRFGLREVQSIGVPIDDKHVMYGYVFKKD